MATANRIFMRDDSEIISGIIGQSNENLTVVAWIVIIGGLAMTDDCESFYFMTAPH